MKNILVYCLLFMALNIHAQKHDYIWQMGWGGTSFNPANVIDFNYLNDSTYLRISIFTKFTIFVR